MSASEHKSGEKISLLKLTHQVLMQKLNNNVLRNKVFHHSPKIQELKFEQMFTIYHQMML